MILDACRDRPNNEFLIRSGAKGLIEGKTVEQNLLVAYAIEAGKVAMDGQAGGNSPYAEALINMLQKNDRPILAMLDDVAEQVAQQTHFKQKLTRSGNLRVNVYLTDAALIKNRHQQIPKNTETIFWGQIKDSEQPEEYLAYLEQYPKDLYSSAADERTKLYQQKIKKNKMHIFRVQCTINTVYVEMRKPI